MADSAYLTPPAAARRLGVSAEKIRLWIIAGELEACDLATDATGGPPRYRISEAALQDFLRRRSAIIKPGKRPFARKKPSTKTGTQ